MDVYFTNKNKLERRSLRISGTRFYYCYIISIIKESSVTKLIKGVRMLFENKKSLNEGRVKLNIYQCETLGETESFPSHHPQ